jgi:hypothetical protein
MGHSNHEQMVIAAVRAASDGLWNVSTRPDPRHVEEAPMLAAPCLRRSRLRGPLIAGAAGLLCLSLVACSGSGSASPLSIDTTLPSAAEASQAPSPAAPSQATGASSAAGSSGPASADTGSASGCRLVTAADVSTAVGQPMTQVDAGTPTACLYGSADQSEQVLISIFPDVATMTAAVDLNAPTEQIDGLGDQAFWSALSGTIFVRKGDRAFKINDPDLAMAHTSDPNVPKTAMTQLATIALKNF